MHLEEGTYPRNLIGEGGVVAVGAARQSIAGVWLQCTAGSERKEEKNMKHQKGSLYDRWTDILEISSIGSSDFSWAQPSQELLLIFISSMNTKSPMSC